jgi:two-component system response regulator ResD
MLGGTMSRLAATTPSKVLVVDDDPVARDFVAMALATQSVEVDGADDAPAALELLAAHRYEAVVLDVNLPSMSGVTLLREVRRLHDVAVVVHTALDDPAFAVIALESGADEYCTKPLAPRELVLRVERAVERHQRALRAAPVLPPDPADGLVVDAVGRRVTVDGTEIELTAKEFDLLLVLSRAPGKVFTRGELLELVWEAKPDWQSVDTITEHVYRLRQKLDQPDATRSWIETVRGAGYRFAAGAPGAMDVHDPDGSLRTKGFSR